MRPLIACVFLLLAVVLAFLDAIIDSVAIKDEKSEIAELDLGLIMIFLILPLLTLLNIIYNTWEVMRF